MANRTPSPTGQPGGDATNDVSQFLRSRRARISPQRAGLSDGYGKRRVPGLRREEVAQLAGVSVDYYVRLEQGRGTHVSDSVLDAVARVLELTDVEREHLGNLVRPRREVRRPRRQTVTAAVQRLLDSMSDVPALVLGRRMDILASNTAADVVFDLAATGSRAKSAHVNGAPVNGARQVFLNSDARQLYLNWEVVAAEVVSHLRLEAGRHPSDPLLASLIGELSINSEAFGRLWATNDVQQKTSGAVRVAHPVAGELEFSYQLLSLAGQPDQFITAYTCLAGSPTDERVQLLLSWAANPQLPEAATASKPEQPEPP